MAQKRDHTEHMNTDTSNSVSCNTTTILYYKVGLCSGLLRLWLALTPMRLTK